MAFESAILCKHLEEKDGLTFYWVSVQGDIGLCGACYLTYGREVAAIPLEDLRRVLPAIFRRKMDKSHPVYRRFIERIAAR